MATQAQIDANRRNAQKSTGPRTREGKACVALNALKHGIRASALVASLRHTPLFDDDPQAFADIVQSLVDRFHPEGPYEEACVEDIAICLWRLRRIVIAETGHIASAQHILLSGPGRDNPRLHERNALPDFDVLERLNRYEVSIQRQLKRSFDTLTALVRQRSAQPFSAAVQKQKDEVESPKVPEALQPIRREVLSLLLDEVRSVEGDPELLVPPEAGPDKQAKQSLYPAALCHVQLNDNSQAGTCCPPQSMTQTLPREDRDEIPKQSHFPGPRPPNKRKSSKTKKKSR